MLPNTRLLTRDLKEYIDTSDDDDDVGDVSLPALTSKGKEAVSAKEPPKKRRKKAATKSSNAEAEGSPATKPRSKQSGSEPGPSNFQPSVDMDVGMNEVNYLCAHLESYLGYCGSVRRANPRCPS